MPKINYYIDTYDYFSKLNNGPIRGPLLDYGSNYGLFLESSRIKNLQDFYTGIDVDLDAIEIGKKMFPKAKFIHYNKHNYMYNSKGYKKLLPNIDKIFKYIISYSVLTHTTKEDMLDTIEILYNKLISKGKLFVTYLDINNLYAVNYFYNKRVKDFGSCDLIRTKNYTYLIDNKLTKIPKEGMFLSFYENDYLIKILKPYKVQLKKSPDISRGCFQDCIIIEKQ